MRPILLITFFAAISCNAFAQGPGLKSIDEVIQGIDTLLEQIFSTRK
jgi:hypothetical protein